MGFKGSHMCSHVGFGILVSLYHWLSSSFVLLGGLWFDEWLMGLMGSHVGFRFLLSLYH